MDKSNLPSCDKASAHLQVYFVVARPLLSYTINSENGWENSWNKPFEQKKQSTKYRNKPKSIISIKIQCVQRGLLGKMVIYETGFHLNLLEIFPTMLCFQQSAWIFIIQKSVQLIETLMPSDTIQRNFWYFKIHMLKWAFWTWSKYLPELNSVQQRSQILSFVLRRT